MIVAPALAAWLASPARQQASKAEAQAVARWWRSQPAVAAFRESLGRCDAQDVTAVTAAARALLDDDGWASALVARLVAAAARDRFFEPPFRAMDNDVHSGLLLIDDPACAVALSHISLDALAAKKAAVGGIGSVAFSGQMTLFRFVAAGGGTLSFWEAERPGPGFTGAGGCRMIARRRIGDGETILIDGGVHAFLIEHAEADLLIAQATIAAARAPLLVEYDARDHGFVSASATDDAASRMQMMATLLRLTGHRQAFDAIAPLTEDARFFLRWHAMRELVALDSARAAPLLRAMAGADDHPAVRRSAAAALALVEERLCPA